MNKFEIGDTIELINYNIEGRIPYKDFQVLEVMKDEKVGVTLLRLDKPFYKSSKGEYYYSISATYCRVIPTIKTKFKIFYNQYE